MTRNNTKAKTAAKSSGKRPGILPVIFFSILIGAVVQLMVGLKLEIEKLAMEKYQLEKELHAAGQDMIDLTVDIQKLQSGERIRQIAETKLAMMKSSDEFSTIQVDKNQIEHIKELTDSKYEKQ